VLLNITHDIVLCKTRVRFRLERIIQKRAMCLIAGADVDGFPQRLTVPRLDRAAVDHDTWSIVSRKCHDCCDSSVRYPSISSILGQ